MQDKDIILNELRKEKRNKDMLMAKYSTTLAWLQKLYRGISLRIMINGYGFNDIIIYGIDDLGMKLIEGCIYESVKVAAISDRRIVEGGYEFNNIPIVQIKCLKEYQSKKTGIIVAAVGYFDEIEENLSNLGLYNIISLRELIEGKNDGAFCSGTK